MVNGFADWATRARTRRATSTAGGFEISTICRVAGSASRRSMAASVVMAPTSRERSRPPVPMAWLMPPPALEIKEETSWMPVPEAPMMPVSPRATSLAKASGTPPMMAVPQSGPISSTTTFSGVASSARSRPRGDVVGEDHDVEAGCDGLHGFGRGEGTGNGDQGQVGVGKWASAEAMVRGARRLSIDRGGCFGRGETGVGLRRVPSRPIVASRRGWQSPGRRGRLASPSAPARQHQPGCARLAGVPIIRPHSSTPCIELTHRLARSASGRRRRDSGRASTSLTNRCSCDPHGLGEGHEGLGEAAHRGLDDTCADLADAGLAMGDAGVDGRHDAGLDDEADVDAGRHALHGRGRVSTIPDSRARVISPMRRVKTAASAALPAPTKPTTAGAAAMAKPPRPIVSTIAESPMSGLASAGAEAREIKPLRHLDRSREPTVAGGGDANAEVGAVATHGGDDVEPSMPATGSMMALPMAMATLRWNWSLRGDEGQRAGRAVGLGGDARPWPGRAGAATGRSRRRCAGASRRPSKGRGR